MLTFSTNLSHPHIDGRIPKKKGVLVRHPCRSNKATEPPLSSLALATLLPGSGAPKPRYKSTVNAIPDQKSPIGPAAKNDDLPSPKTTFPKELWPLIFAMTPYTDLKELDSAFTEEQPPPNLDETDTNNLKWCKKALKARRTSAFGEILETLTNAVIEGLIALRGPNNLVRFNDDIEKIIKFKGIQIPSLIQTTLTYNELEIKACEMLLETLIPDLNSMILVVHLDAILRRPETFVGREYQHRVTSINIFDFNNHQILYPLRLLFALVQIDKFRLLALNCIELKYPKVFSRFLKFLPWREDVALDRIKNGNRYFSYAINPSHLSEDFINKALKNNIKIFGSLPFATKKKPEFLEMALKEQFNGKHEIVPKNQLWNSLIWKNLKRNDETPFLFLCRKLLPHARECPLTHLDLIQNIIRKAIEQKQSITFEDLKKNPLIAKLAAADKRRAEKEQKPGFPSQPFSILPFHQYIMS